VLSDAAITEAATAVREFEKAGISPPERLVAIAGRALNAAGPAAVRSRPRRARP
jgi:hypothetical protein